MLLNLADLTRDKKELKNISVVVRVVVALVVGTEDAMI